MVSASQLQLEQTPAEPGRRPVEAPNRSIPMEGPWQKPPAASFLCPFRKRRVGAQHPFSVFFFTLLQHRHSYLLLQNTASNLCIATQQKTIFHHFVACTRVLLE